MRGSLLWLAALFVVSGCATFRGAVPASKDRWFVITTTNFVVYTDVDERTAGKAAEELEATRDALIAAVSPGATFPNLVRTRVFVLASANEFHEIFGPQLSDLFVPGADAAFYLHAPIESVPRAGPPTKTSSSKLRHAMAHQLIAAAYARAPPWLDEGLAQVLETAYASPDGRSVMLGGLNTKARARFIGNATVPLQRMLAWNEPVGALPDREGLALYGTSYVFVHWLLSHHTENLADYLRALRSGIDPKKAWEGAFPGFDPDATAKILADYARGEFPVTSRPFLTSAPFLEPRQLSAPDVHVVRARIMLGAARFAGSRAREFEAKARWEIKQALVLSPAHVEALALDTGSLSENRLRWAHQATSDHPEDGRAFALLAAVSSNAKDREREYRHSLALNPAEPKVLHAFGVFLLGQGRPSEALPLVERALRHAPYDFDVIDTYADVLEKLNRCGAAVVEALRAAHHAREADEKSVQRMTRRWNERKAACRAREGAEPGPEAAVGAGMQPSDRAGVDSAAPNDDPFAIFQGPVRPVTPGGENAGPDSADQRQDEITDEGVAPGAHSGWMGGAEFGWGYLFGSFEGTGTFSGLIDGTSLDAGASFGFWLVPEMSMSVEAGILSHSFSDQPIKNVNFGTTDGFALARLGLLADFYTSASSPFHLAIGIDLVRGTWNSHEGIYGTPLPGTDGMIGHFGHASAGFAWRVLGAKLGPSLRLCQGSAEGDLSSVSFRGLALLGNATF